MSTHDPSRPQRTGPPTATARQISEARKELGTLSRQVRGKERVFVFRRHGRDESVLLSFEYYEELEAARLELERIKARESVAGAVDSIRRARERKRNDPAP